MIQKVKRLIILGVFFGLILLTIFYWPKILGDVFYPLPDPEKLAAMRAAAAEFPNVPLALIVAVAKHESGFRAEALSPAGARGVMQIVPGTGVGLARDLGLANFTTQTLFDPTINIRLGTYYLARLLTKYGNDVRATLAHYNAGPRGPDLLGDPNRELKVYRGVEGYTRRVINSQAIYEQLYGKSLDQASVSSSVVKQEKPLGDQLKELKNLLPLLFK